MSAVVDSLMGAVGMASLVAVAVLASPAWATDKCGEVGGEAWVLAGSPYVIYFYPRDDTPGCTTEACDFSSGIRQFGKLRAKVVGCSPDSVESHLGRESTQAEQVLDNRFGDPVPNP